MSINPVTVSVIVPAFNASATLGRTLAALATQDCFQPFEVIVVDDGSTDNTAEVARSFRDVKYVRQENAGPASARNHGAAVARGEFLAFTDSDCVPHADWILKLMAGFVVDKVGVVTGSYGIANPSSRLARCVYAEILWRHNHLLPDFLKVFGSYNFCVRKEVFEAVGGFNTGYRFASGEDNDLSYKITARGWRIYFERRALVDHFHPVAVAKYLKEQFRHGFWRVKMYTDHPAMMKGDGYTFWKDMVEIPWALGVLVLWGTVLLKGTEGKGTGTKMVAGLMALPPFWSLSPLLLFLAFEIVWAMVMARDFVDGIFFGFVLFLRAFSRALGFSTGILTFLPENIRKIF